MRKVLVLVLVASGLSAVMAPGSHAGPGRGNFVVGCRFSHRLPDDPIVYPRQPGASHLHNFFGNSTTDAFSTVDSMRDGATTCELLQDTAGYWNPAGYLNGERLRPRNVVVYYSGLPTGNVETIPPGLQMIGGDAHATSPEANGNVTWFCGTERTPVSSHPYNCERYGENKGVTGVVTFPTCWDGIGITEEHVRYWVRHFGCPEAFPHVLPRLIYEIHFGIQDPCAGHFPCAPESSDAKVRLTLSSGPYFTLHADFWNTWMQDKLNQLVATCLNQHVRCKKQISFFLSVQKTGTGTGTVWSYPAGINCGSTCKAIYGKGTTVSLTGQPDFGSTLTWWAGDCTGSTSCVLKMDKNKLVTAIFERTG